MLIQRFFTLALAIGLSVTSLLPGAASAQTKDVRDYVTADALFAMVAYPERVLSSPEYRLMPLEVFQAAGQEQLGLDPLTVEQVLVFGLPNPAGEVPVDFGAVFRFSKPIDRDALLSRLEKDVEGIDRVAGPKFYQLRGRNAPVFAIPDDQTILFGLEARLDRMLEKRTTTEQSPIQKALAAEDLPDVYVVGDIASLRPLLGFAINAIREEVPAPYRAFLDLPNLIKAVEVEATLRGTGQLKLHLDTNDDAAAKRVLELLTQAKDMGRAILDQELRRADQSESLTERATAAYARRVTDELTKQYWPKQDGNRLTVQLDGQSAAVAGVMLSSAMLIPAVRTTQVAAQRMQSMNNLKQLSLAIMNYESAYRKFPQDVVDANGRRLWSWRVHLLPMLDQQAIYDRLKLDEPWDSEHNSQFTSIALPLFRSPASEAAPNSCSYLAVSGKGMIFGNGLPRTTFANIRDGSSNTIMLVEVDDSAAQPWAKPGDLQVDENNPTQHLGGIWPNVFLAAMADGSVHSIANDIDTQTLWSMFTMAGGELIRQ
jgi:hypothetical protein